MRCHFWTPRAAVLHAVGVALLGGVSMVRAAGLAPEARIGERLFLETRFAQFFFTNSGGNANAILASGDPTMDTTATTNAPLPGPYAGASMNCSACHLTSQHSATVGPRAYCDFARRSPIPRRDDGLTHTPRNAPPLINALRRRGGATFLHFDGEFVTAQDLVVGTLTGRNYGWLPDEREAAVTHAAHIIRHDDGLGALARATGGPYRRVFAGTDPELPGEFRLPQRLRLDVDQATDRQIVRAVATLVTAYLKTLNSPQDESGRFNGSPYDVFLIKNSLPRRPAPGETAIDYARRLRRRVASLENPQFVSEADGMFRTHQQAFAFGPTELTGLRIFLAEPHRTRDGFPASHVGNCIPCHAPPVFTDFKFHNVGATQEEYDAIHGTGAFERLPVPGLRERLRNPERYLPSTAKRPAGSGRFAAVPSEERPGWVDLGLWNVYANRGSPVPQAALRNLLGESYLVSPYELLPRTIARFKTPGLRNLGHSAPYMHTGRFDSLEEVAEFYWRIGGKARADTVRNASAHLRRIGMEPADFAPLAAFLRSLNEDVE